MSILPASVTILDLPAAASATSTMAFEASYTASGGNATTVQVALSQLTGTTFGNLPTGGATGQFLQKQSNANFDSAWVNLASSFVAGTSIIISGSTTVTIGVDPAILTGNLPAGGSTSQILQKLSDADYSAAWVNPVETIGISGGTSITVATTATTVLVSVTDFGIGSGQLATFAVLTDKIGTSQVTFDRIQNISALAVLGNAGSAVGTTAAIVASGGSQIPVTNPAGTAVLWQSVSTTLDQVIGSARGMIATRGTTVWTNLALGSTGLVPTSDGTALAYLAPPVIRTNSQAPYNALVILSLTSATISLAASAVTLFDTNNTPKRFGTLSATVSLATTGVANGLDTGTETSSIWYHIWAIGQENGTVAGLFSASSTSPTLPSGFTYRGYMGATYNNSSSHLDPFLQRGNLAICPITTVLSAGTSTTFVAVNLAAAIPPTAVSVSMRLDPSSSSGTNAVTLITAPDGSGTSATYGFGPTAFANMDTVGLGYGPLVCALSTAQQIVYRVSGTNARTSLNVMGWGF